MNLDVDILDNILSINLSINKYFLPNKIQSDKNSTLSSIIDDFPAQNDKKNEKYNQALNQAFEKAKNDANNMMAGIIDSIVKSTKFDDYPKYPAMLIISINGFTFAPKLCGELPQVNFKIGKKVGNVNINGDDDKHQKAYFNAICSAISLNGVLNLKPGEIKGYFKRLDGSYGIVISKNDEGDVFIKLINGVSFVIKGDFIDKQVTDYKVKTKRESEKRLNSKNDTAETLKKISKARKLKNRF